MTTLRKYLDTHEIGIAAFAEVVSISPASVSRLAAGLLKPSLETAHRIERATAGEVPTECWLDDRESAAA